MGIEGDLNVGGKITSSSMPVLLNDIPNKMYVDSVAQGFGPKLSVKFKTTVVEADRIVNNCIFNGIGVGKTITNDTNGSIAGSLNDRILFAGGTVDSQHYGIYIIKDLGSLATPWVLERATDCDNSPTGEVVKGIYTFVSDIKEGWSLVLFNGNIDVDNQRWTVVSGITELTTQVIGQGTGNDALTVFNGNGISLNPTQLTNIGTLVENLTLNSNAFDLNATSSTINSSLVVNGNFDVLGNVIINQSGSGTLDLNTNTNTGNITIGSSNNTITLSGTCNINNIGTNTTNIGRVNINSGTLGGTNNILGITNINATGVLTTTIGSITGVREDLLQQL